MTTRLGFAIQGALVAGALVAAGPTQAARKLPALSIEDASIVEGHAGQADLVFTLSLSAPRAGDVTVTATTSNGSATAGPDYAATAMQVTIPAGQTSAAFAVLVIGDADDEPDETFTVTLSSPAGAVIADGTAIGTIVDDDDERARPWKIDAAGGFDGHA